MAKKSKKNTSHTAPASQGVTLGDLLGKKLESVKRKSEEKQKIMIKEARSNPAVLKSSEKFSATTKAAPKQKAAPKPKQAAK